MIKRVIVALLLLSAVRPVWAGNAEELIPGQAVTGSIEERGEQDVYTYTGAGGERIRINASADDSDLDTILELISPDGEQVARNDDIEVGDTNSQIRFTLPDDGTYQVVVSGFGNTSTGAYELLLTVEGQAEAAPDEETTEPDAAQHEAEEDGQIRGELSPNRFTSGTLAAGGVDIWTWTPDANWSTQFELNPDGFSGVLEIYNGGELLESGSPITVYIEAGESYEIWVRGETENDGGDYTLRLISAPAHGPEEEHSPVEEQEEEPAALELQLDEPATGELPSGEAVIWTFTPSDDVVVDISMTSTDFDTVVEIYTGETLYARNDDSPRESTLNSLIEAVELEGGQTYDIWARSYQDQGSGEYTLLITPSTATPSDTSTPTSGDDDSETLAYGETVEGSIAAGEAVRYFFDGTEGDRISISVDATFDTVMELYAPGGEFLISDDDSGSGLNPLIEGYPLPDSGRYEIMLYGFSDERSGDYALTLTLGDLAAEEEEPEEEATPVGGDLAYGDSVSDTLEVGTSAEYTFEGGAGDIVSVLVDADFDGLLELFDEEDTVVAQDDDSGEGLNPLLQSITLPADGTYRLVLRGFGGNSGGDFTLTLIEGAAVVETPEETTPEETTPEETTPEETPETPEETIPADLPIVLTYGTQTEAELPAGGQVVFTFEGSAGDTVTIEVLASHDGVMELQAPDGGIVAADDDGGTGLSPLIQGVTLEQTGTFTVVYRGFSASESGAFTITLDFGEPLPVAQPLTIGQTLTATYSPDAASDFTFEGSAGQTVSIAAASQRFDNTLDLYVELYDPQGNLIATDDDSGFALNASLVGVELPATGTYTLAVRAFAGQGDFYLTVVTGAAYLSPAGSAAQPLDSQAGVVTLPVSFTAGQSALYQFELETGLELLFTAPNLTSGEVAFALYAPSGRDYLLDEQPFLTPEAGEYLLLVYSEAGAQGEIEVSFGAEAPVEVVETEAGILPAGTIVRAALLPGEQQKWVFEPVISGAYTFILNSEDSSRLYDPYLVLRDENGDIIAEDDDSGGNFNALLSAIALEGGRTYTVEVRSFADRSGGAFALVATLQDPATPDMAEGGQLTLDETTEAELSAAGGQVTFSFEAESDGEYNFNIDGLTLPYIDVYNADGELVGRGAASIKALSLPAGAYQVVVYDRLNRTGDFSLSVSAGSTSADE